MYVCMYYVYDHRVRVGRKKMMMMMMMIFFSLMMMMMMKMRSVKITMIMKVM